MTNNGCNRYCEVMNRPAYIVLFKGDDSDFEGNQSVDIVIDTELDTTGMKAHFRFMDFVQDFNSIPENKTLSLVFPNAKTSEFPLGAADATLRFEDASGKFRTVSNRIHIVVTNSVNEAYDNEDSQSITVTVKGTVTWDMIEGKPTFATVATSGSYNDLTDKPTIPAPVTIDPDLSQTSENPVQNKVVAKALYTGFTEWQFSGDTQSGHTYSVVLAGGYAYLYDGNTEISYLADPDSDTEIDFDLGMPAVDIIATRHLVTPTKTSQLTNDGPPATDPNAGHPFATTNQIPAPVDISGKLDGAAAYEAWESGIPYPAGAVVSHNGRLWICLEPNTSDEPSVESSDWEMRTIYSLKQDALSSAQLASVNSGATAEKVATWDGYAAQIAQKADAADLPYAMVTPGEWEFSDGLNHQLTGPIFDGESLWYYSTDNNLISQYFNTEADASAALSLSFGDSLTATRPSLPGHLLDRAVNAVSVTDTTTLTLPALANAGKARDFLVRLTISGSTVPTITFAAPTGETIVYETDGDEFPVPDEAGTWLYSFTECQPHKFAVSLKQLQSVSQPTQTQGGE